MEEQAHLWQARARREEAQERLKQSTRELALCEDDVTALAQSRSEEEARQRLAQTRRDKAQKLLHQSALGLALSDKASATPSPACGEPPTPPPQGIRQQSALSLTRRGGALLAHCSEQVEQNPIRRVPSLPPMPIGINRLGSRRGRRVAVGIINEAPPSCATIPSGTPGRRGLPKKAVRTYAQSEAHLWLSAALTTADDDDDSTTPPMCTAPLELLPEESPEESGGLAVEPARAPPGTTSRAERLARALGPTSLRRV